MASVAKKVATYDDVLNAPEHKVAEIIHGSLILSPRPASRHTRAASKLGRIIGGPFDYDRDGPGGWVILDEPELHLGPDILVPDLGGWRRSRMPEIPDAAFFSLAPDWVCEVLSPSTETIDRGDKVPLYASQGIGHVWLLSPTTGVLEVLELDGGSYWLVSTFKNDERARANPFEQIELELAALWAR